jgi:hypothetical protein
MAKVRSAASLTEYCDWHVACLVSAARRAQVSLFGLANVMASGPFTQPLSVRAHFWLRLAGVLVILAAQFGPRIVGSLGVAAAPVPSAAAGIALVAQH